MVYMTLYHHENLNQPLVMPGRRQLSGQSVWHLAFSWRLTKVPPLQEYLSSSNSEDMTLREDSDVLSGLPDSRLLPGMRGHRLDLLEGATHSGDMHPTDTNTTSTESSDLQNPSLTQFSLDEDGRILPYVNFDLYYQAIEDAREAGLISDSQIHLYK